MNCPKCKGEIAPNNINIQADIAQCSNCQNVFKISEQIHHQQHNTFDVKWVPRRTYYRKERDTIIMGGKVHSVFKYIFIPFALMWSGGAFIGVFTMLFTANFKNSIFNLIFPIPFLIAALLLLSVVAFLLFGKVEFTLNRQGGTVFTGVKNMGIRKHFAWADIDTITERQSRLAFPGRSSSAIALEGKKRILAGGALTDESCYFLKRALQQAMYDYKKTW